MSRKIDSFNLSDSSSEWPSKPIGVDEAKEHIKFIEAILNNKNPKGRKHAIIEGFMEFGPRFGWSLSYLANLDKKNNKNFPKLFDEAMEVTSQWLTGTRFTDRADEDECRVLCAEWMIDQSKNQKLLNEKFSHKFLRLGALAILELPENHPLRDVTYTRQTLLNYLEECRKEKDADGQVLIIKDLLHYKFESLEKSLELIEQGKQLLKDVSDHALRQNFLFSIIGYYCLLAIEERDKGNTDAMHQLIEKTNMILEEIKPENIQPSDITAAGNWLLLGLVKLIDNKPREAADIFARIIDSVDPYSNVAILAAKHEGRLRINLGHYDRAIKVLSSFVPIYEERYLTSVEDTAVMSTGEDFSKLINNLAFVYAYLGQWDLAIKYLERGKSLRLRYQTILRQSSHALPILEIEKALYSLSRGVALTQKKISVMINHGPGLNKN